MSVLKVWDEASQSYQEFPAIKGEPGKTPVKGEDYFTEADKQEIVDAVVSALPLYKGEVVDA